MIKTLWKQQTKLLFRQAGLLMTLLLFSLIATFSLYSGHAIIRQQNLYIDSLDQLYKQDKSELLEALGDTATAIGRQKASQAGTPEVINYRLPQNAVNRPTGLAILSVGTREVAPFYDRVRTNVSFLNPANGTIFNPLLLFLGKIDFSFVLLYLLPLVVIIFCYDLGAMEKEQGTLPLLRVQGLSDSMLYLGKITFRLALIWSVYLLLQVFAFIIAYMTAPFSLIEAVQWTLLFSGWLFLWFIIGYAFLHLNLSSHANAIALICSWVLMLFLLPNMLNSYVNSRYPIPLRTDIASYERHQSELIWEMRPSDLVDSFHRYNPAYTATFIPARDTAHLSRRFVAGYYDLLARRLRKKNEELQRELSQREYAAKRYSSWVPGVFIQYAANCLAHTDLEAQRSFEKAVADFQSEWKNFLYQFQLSERNLRPSDFARFPVFKMAYRSIKLPVMHLLYPWVLGILILITSILLLCLKQKH